METNLIIKTFFLCVAIILLSCEKNSLEHASLISVMGEASPRSISAQEESVVGNLSPVVFTGDDISWFNPNTREIKFTKSFNPDELAIFQKLHFFLGEKQLFTVSTYVKPLHSFASNDLVLYIEADGKCYLHDCYPLSIMETDPTVEENKEKRAIAWDQFVDQLKKERKTKNN
jgi:hypothetical protein